MNPQDSGAKLAHALVIETIFFFRRRGGICRIHGALRGAQTEDLLAHRSNCGRDGASQLRHAETGDF
jgi:hypothetical protein